MRLVTILIFTLLFGACDRAEETQSEYKPRWQKYINSDSNGAAKEIQMLIGAVDRSSSQENPEILVLTCRQGVTKAYVVWRRYLGVFDPEITWQVGSDPTVTETWTLSADNEATFAPAPLELIKQMMMNDLFLIKTTLPSGVPVTMEFKTTGLKTEITELREACKW